MKAFSKIFILITVSGVLISCGHPLRYFYTQLKKYGYIAYNNPLKESGPGTLLGGTPKNLYLVAGPQICFPDEIEGVPTHIREYDESVFPSSSYEIEVEARVYGTVFKFLQAGSPTIKAGAKLKHITKFDLAFKDIHLEYFNLMRLEEFYNTHISDRCKEYLEEFGFVIQAVKAKELVFQFYTENGGLLELDVENIRDMIDIEFDVEFVIREGTKLVIKTPKFIGYQMGKLRSEDGGKALYRASKTNFNKYEFEHIATFRDEEEESELTLELKKDMKRIPVMESFHSPGDFLKGLSLGDGIN